MNLFCLSHPICYNRLQLYLKKKTFERKIVKIFILEIKLQYKCTQV